MRLAKERVVDRFDEPDVRSPQTAMGDRNAGRAGASDADIAGDCPVRDGSGKSARGSGGGMRGEIRTGDCARLSRHGQRGRGRARESGKILLHQLGHLVAHGRGVSGTDRV